MIQIKRWVKNIVYRFPDYSSEYLIKQIEKYNVISFDIFDTLIKRCVKEPTDIFRICAEEYNIKYNPIDAYDFQRKRVDAEAHARANNCNKEKEEITIDDIYNEFTGTIYDDIKEILKQTEIELEYRLCVENKIIKKVYDWGIENKKRVYIISDMYLDIEHVKRMLEKCGYFGYEKLYLSSEVGLKKNSSNLFGWFITENNIDPKECIHIGDTIKDDYISAKKKGIKSIRIARNPNRLSFLRFEKSDNTGQADALKMIINNTVDCEASKYYLYGYEIVGPLLFGYSRWLYEECRSLGIEHLFFLARDGYLLQKAFELLYGKQFNSEYAYLSRRSLSIPLINKDYGLKDIFKNETKYFYWNLKHICKLIGLEYNDVLPKWKESGLDEQESFLTEHAINDARINVFFDSIKKKIIQNSAEEKVLLNKYLDQIGFQGKIAIADVGWSGTLQRYLSRILPEADITGLYLGSRPGKLKSLKAKAYISEEENPGAYCTALIEFPLSPSEGSQKKYVENIEGRVEPTFYGYELKDYPEQIKMKKEMQKGCIDSIKELKESCYQVKDNKELYRGLKMITKKPSLSNVKVLGDLLHVDRGVHKLANPNGIVHYVLHFNDLKRDFTNAGWKIGFLRRLFVLPLCYESIIDYKKASVSKDE